MATKRGKKTTSRPNKSGSSVKTKLRSKNQLMNRPSEPIERRWKSWRLKNFQQSESDRRSKRKREKTCANSNKLKTIFRRSLLLVRQGAASFDSAFPMDESCQEDSWKVIDLLCYSSLLVLRASMSPITDLFDRYPELISQR